ncbi:uncharacterized protein LOC126890325 [Diabrotica virgifera virgifera]|uniref:Peptidase aspartic putative domain-containing protein n=1 Tax=Diabrotica virgifera virgifera TaxID=50390 RepID=A0ABM5KY91_DIAVI|nr:uncharacterized protein LOC126890325 [Diabrotica virgifera virgifera]
MPMKASDFRQLYRKRDIIEQRLNNFIKFIESMTNIAINDLSEDHFSQIELNTERTESLFTEFDEIQMSIELNCQDQDIQQEYAKRQRLDTIFSKTFSRARTMLKRKCSDLSSSQSKRLDISHEYSGLEGVKLPPIQLPVFHGDYLKWIEFKDTFEGLIHNNKVLADIQKYHYLRASLKGDALKIIQSLDFSAQNYNSAWQTLCNRFDNSRMLVNNHLKALFEIENLNKESALGLRSMIDSVKKHLFALKSLQLPTEHWDAIMVYLVSGKLDKFSSREWEKRKIDNSLPSLNEFLEFLKNRADFLETIELSNVTKPDYKSNYQDKRSRSLLTSKSRSCNFCKQNHLIYLCEEFLKLSVAQRWDKIKQLNLCRNCLCTGHSYKQCKSFGCKICKAKHSSLLHENKPSDIHVKENSSINFNPNNDSENEPNKVKLSTNTSENNVNRNEIVLKNNCSNNDYVLLSTAKVRVHDRYGNTHIARVILDSGSQSCFITEDFLNLKQGGSWRRLDVKGPPPPAAPGRTRVEQGKHKSKQKQNEKHKRHSA